MSTVDHPQHYQSAAPLARPILKLLIDESLLDLECIVAIERLNLGFLSGNAIKYMWRAGQKSDLVLEDLQKSRWYLVRCLNYGHLCGLGNMAKAIVAIDELLAATAKDNPLAIGSKLRICWEEGSRGNRLLIVRARVDDHVVTKYRPEDENQWGYGLEHVIYLERLLKDGIATVAEDFEPIEEQVEEWEDEDADCDAVSGGPL